MGTTQVKAGTDDLTRKGAVVAAKPLHGSGGGAETCVPRCQEGMQSGHRCRSLVEWIRGSYQLLVEEGRFEKKGNTILMDKYDQSCPFLLNRPPTSEVSGCSYEKA